MNIVKVLFSTAVICALSACSSDDDPVAGPVSVTTVSGVQLALTGSYAKGCVSDGGGSEKGTLEFSASDIAISGWVYDNGDPIPPPATADGTSGQLLPDEPVTPITVTITSAGFGFPVGETGILFFVVDDTTAATQLYGDENASVNNNAEGLNPFVLITP